MTYQETFTKWCEGTTLYDLVTSKPMYRYGGASPKVLLTPTLSQKITSTPLIDVHDGMQLADVIIQLSSLDVLYLPVYRLEEQTEPFHSHIPKYLYWISALEVIQFLVLRRKIKENSGGELSDAEVKAVLETTVYEVHDIYLSGHSWTPFEILPHETTLRQLLNRWKTTNSSHLTPFATEAGKHGLQVITPTDFLRYFNLASCGRHQRFADLTETNIDARIKGDVRFVRGKLQEPALLVFARMAYQNANVAGIEDNTSGNVVMHLSASDILPNLKGNGTEWFLEQECLDWYRSLQQPLFAFVSSLSYKSSSLAVHGLDIFSIPTKNVSLSTVIRKMLQHSVHQVWRRCDYDQFANDGMTELINIHHIISFLNELFVDNCRRTGSTSSSSMSLE